MTELEIAEKKIEEAEIWARALMSKHGVEARAVKDAIAAAKRERNRLINEIRAKEEAEFKARLFREAGIENHPKRDLLYAKAYELGHSCGFSEVEIYFNDLLELIK